MTVPPAGISSRPLLLAVSIVLLLASAACGRREGAPVTGADAATSPDTENVGTDATADTAIPDSATAPDAPAPGCADGTREGFLSVTRYPRIAGCSGGFAVAGLAGAVGPVCARNAGNDSKNPAGSGCSAADLCAEGWHVCTSATEVAARSPEGCAGASDAPFGTFFATRQSGPGCNLCARGPEVCDACQMCGMAGCRQECRQTAATVDDFFGCGDVGYPASGSCAPLTRASGNNCETLPRPWSCPTPAGRNEADTVVKPGPESGGVLCCSDAS
jgi:hypothetical protein